MKHTRRVAVLALVFLIIGAAVNVGVAWGCIRQARYADAWWAKEQLERAWPVGTPHHWPPPLAAHRIGGVGWEHEERWTPAPRDVNDWSTYASWVGRAGWPLRALTWEVHADGSQGATSGIAARATGPPSLIRRGLDYPWNWTAQDLWHWKRLPLLPLWPGVAVNTVAYMALAGLSWCFGRAAVRAIRRQAKFRRGLCQSCGYPRAGLPQGAVCPECGGENGFTAKNA
jgi:hypothetical protein